MSFKKTFCPSPWFHTRINNAGHYEYCRWAVKHDRLSQPHISQRSPQHWFQQDMQVIRQSMVAGESLDGCQECILMEQHGKISGRQRQLLKIGVTVEDFDKTMLSSQWIDQFHADGSTHQLPQDWQIDLGNFCNSACVFCEPHSSSRLAAEHKKLGLIQQVPPRSWCDDPHSLKTFIDTLCATPHLTYLHFIGGETLITPAFAKILQALVDNKLSQAVTVGFTTNLTVWDQSVADLLCNFHQVNLGMSVECIHPLNDYVRYGGNINTTMQLMEKWLELARQQNWLTQLRITPTALTMIHLDTVYEYAMKNQLAVESCNFLNDPPFMRPSVLPSEHRQHVIDQLQSWIDQFDVHCKTLAVNTRNPNWYQTQIIQDATSYVNYLMDQPDESFRLPQLVQYLKSLESIRGNSILDYLPEYEELFRSAGY